jgi:hypothetical protein
MYFHEWSTRGSTARRLPALLLLCSALWAKTANAEGAAPGETSRSLPGIVRVGVPTPTAAPVVVGGSVGYGFMEETSVLEGGHRGTALGAVAFSPLPALSFALDVQGRLDKYPDLDGDSVKLYGEPRLAARFVRAATPTLFWGVELDARFVGAEAPSVEPAATSPSLRGLFGYQLRPTTWLAANLGFHLDRSAKAVPDPGLLASADKRTLGASSFNAVPWGLGASHRLERTNTELLGEVGGEFLVGSGKPKVSRSPSRLILGARQPLSRIFSLLGSAEVSLSKRPLTMVGDDLIPIEPRFSIGVALLARFGLPERERQKPKTDDRAPRPEPKVVPPAPPPEKAKSPMRGTVVDEGGRPLPDAEVTIEQPNEEPLVVRTDAEGRFEFEGVPEGSLALSVATAGFDPVKVEVGATEERTREIVLHPSVPAGQLRGKVTDLGGDPLLASVVVMPGNERITVGPDGAFELELAPGQYTVSFRLEGYRPQKRKVTVANRGVVILNIALTR